jgi:hypothetical protein
LGAHRPGGPPQTDALAAGLAQAENSDPELGPGAQGYGQRDGAALADQASSYFFQDFAYPAIFFEDPRYYRLRRGMEQSSWNYTGPAKRGGKTISREFPNKRPGTISGGSRRQNQSN